MIEIDDLVGIPFVPGGRSRSGADCWWVVMECMRRRGVEIPDPFRIDHQDAIPRGTWTEWIASRFAGWSRLDHPAPGCVVLFAARGDYPDHAGIMLDHQRFLHAVRGAGVVIGRLNRCPYRLMGAYEYIG